MICGSTIARLSFPPVVPRRQRARSLLRALVRLVAVLAVVGSAGLATGVALSRLGDEDDPAARTGVTTAGEGAQAQVGLRVLGAVLHPAATPSGRQRKRARLILRLQAQNSGRRNLDLGSPVLAVGDTRIDLDRAAETPGTRFGELAPGETRGITVRFELAGTVTAQVTRDRRARVVVADRSLPVRVTIGDPVRPPQTAPVQPAATPITTPAVAASPDR